MSKEEFPEEEENSVKENNESEESRDSEKVEEVENSEDLESLKNTDPIKEPGNDNKNVKNEKPKKPLGKRILHFIIGFIIYLIIVAALSAIYFICQKSVITDEDEPVADLEAIEETLEWGDIYIQILDDEENFNNLEDIQIALCDIKQDETPELIVYGKKSNGKNSASIYNINSKGEVDTVKFELEEEFNTEFLYDEEDDEYDWYIVTDSEKLYEINLEEDDYVVEKSDDNYDEFDVVETSEKTSFEPGEDDADKILKEVKSSYVPADELKETYASSDKKSSNNDKNTISYESDYIKFVEDYEYDLVYSSPNLNYYLAFVDEDLDNIPKMYIFEEDASNKNLYISGKCGMFENSITDLMGPYSNNMLKLVKNSKGEYCYLEYYNTVSQYSSDSYYYLTNATTGKYKFLSHIDQDITDEDKAYYLAEMDYNTYMNMGGYGTEIPYSDYNNYLTEFEEYVEADDLLEDYCKIKLDGTDKESIIKAIPEAYAGYEKVQKMINK